MDVGACAYFVGGRRHQGGRGQWNRIAWAAVFFAVLAPLMGYERVGYEVMSLIYADYLGVVVWHEFLQIFLPFVISMAAVWRYLRNRGKPYIEPSPHVLNLRFVYLLGFWLNVLLWYGVGFTAVVMAPMQSPSEIPDEYWHLIGRMISHNTVVVAVGCSIGLISWTLFARYLLKQIEAAEAETREK